MERSKSRPSIRLFFPLLMLGVCVFLWGFGYKLSLYNSNPRTLHTIPEAKLLSKNEDSRAADGVRKVIAKAAFPRPVTLFQLAVVTIAIAWACGSCWYLDGRSSEDSKLLHVAILSSSLYFRPPPIHSAL